MVDIERNNSVSLKPLCSVSTDKNQIDVGKTLTLSVTCAKTSTDKYDPEFVKKAITLVDDTLEVVDSSIEETVIRNLKDTNNDKENAFNLETVDYLSEEGNNSDKSLTFLISAISSNRAGSRKLIVPGNLVIDNNGRGNDFTVSDFKINVKDVNSKVSCYFNDNGWLYTATVKKGNTTSVTLVCDSELLFKKLSPNVSGDSHVSIERIGRAAVTQTKSGYEAKFDIGLKGKKFGWGDITLNTGGVSNISGNSNGKVTSGTIRVRLLFD